MDTNTIEAAGFIVSDDICIWGTGETADGAWANMLHEMGIARIEVLDEAEADARVEADHDHGGWIRASGFETTPATAALLAEVKAHGGKIAWGKVNGISCTCDEEDEAA